MDLYIIYKRDSIGINVISRRVRLTIVAVDVL